MPSINISGTFHNYELTAPAANTQRPSLVFIHGWLLSHHYWQPLVSLLKPYYQCLTYDLRGFGNSQTTTTPPKQEYSLASYAQDLKILLQKLEIERAWLIGHSLGGSIALWTANICSETIQGVTCINSGGGIYLKEEFERFRTAGKQLVKFRPRWLPYIPGLELIFCRMMVAHPLNLQWGRQRIRDFVSADSQAALGSLLDSTTEAEVHHLPQLVFRLEQPVYFIAGAKDKVMELKYVNHLASFHALFDTPQGNVFEIPDCGHIAMLEHPEQVAKILGDILQQNCKSSVDL
ncbi:MAG: alpha/beta hydrolase [Xenococcaceae cyanobacterium MO_167.B27]|nr:alpha/beta hydrolase [Xenococcaceae cyanobacterium MO_167.B27]